MFGWCEGWFSFCKKFNPGDCAPWSALLRSKVPDLHEKAGMSCGVHRYASESCAPESPKIKFHSSSPAKDELALGQTHRHNSGKHFRALFRRRLDRTCIRK